MTSRRILVVDDEPINLALTKAFFFGMPDDVTLASSGTRALELLEDPQQHFDVVLLDLMMPGLDGFEVLRRIRTHPLHRELAVIVQSGNGDVGHIDRAMRGGANEYLVKPFVLDTLLSALGRVCSEPGTRQ
ncbi:response regulator [Uliginosibacterium sp. H1]|uniref:response regulator n=1 Tax=Uliginosibacterium sp. H1 TaxID=3114757 RepID=UPI002E18CB96|nr:response regulator [Uliginosibacterium sp. H1]